MTGWSHLQQELAVETDTMKQRCAACADKNLRLNLSSLHTVNMQAPAQTT